VKESLPPRNASPAPVAASRPFNEKPLGRVGVIGLGHVGVPLAAVLARTYSVVGVDVRDRAVEAVAKGESPLRGAEPGLAEMLAEAVGRGRLEATKDCAACSGASVILVCVDTPLELDRKPDTRNLALAAEGLGRNLPDGALVVLESTVAPGTSRNFFVPKVESASGRRCGRDFYYAHAPERVMPGRLLRNLETYERVIGGWDGESTRRAVEFYGSFLQVKLHATDALTAEIVKSGENAYRDVQIGFANEVALLCEDLGADVWEVRRLINTSPFRDMHVPGAGVGGHCLPKDSWLLIANTSRRDGVITAARAVNDAMPAALVKRVERALKKSKMGFLPRELKVTVLGASYLGDSGDTRNSPALETARLLRGKGFAVRVHDPHAEGEGIERDLEACVAGSDCLLLATAHSAYRSLDLPAIGRKMRTRVIVDGRAAIDEEKARAAGFEYKRLGRGEPDN
jgi:UDP-N-acetyl-D-mannosaminuronic acid dehydrogenase